MFQFVYIYNIAKTAHYSTLFGCLKCSNLGMKNNFYGFLSKFLVKYRLKKRLRDITSGLLTANYSDVSLGFLHLSPISHSSNYTLIIINKLYYN